MSYNFYENDKWLISQKVVELRNNNFFIKERQIWWISFWYNIWKEIFWKWNDFKRPFLILKKAWNMYIWLPLTINWKYTNFYYDLWNNYTNEKSYLIFSQIKSFDKKRFIEKIWTVSNEDFEKIKKEFQIYLFWNS